MEKPNIKKIAALAGVSATTVSYVLNGRPGISQKTRSRVLQIIERENYMPAARPRREALRRSLNLFLVIDDLASFGNLFYSAILDTVTVAAAKYGYYVSVSNQTDAFRTSEAARAVRQGYADGVILLHDPDTDALLFLQQEKVPFVVIDSHAGSAGFARVCADYELAACTAVRYLLSLGHSRIGFVGQRAVPDFYIATFHGYCRALAEAQLSLRPEWLQSEASDFDSAAACAERLLACGERPTALFCASDLFALACISCIRKHGGRIPEDYSVIGIDDLYLSRIYCPALTTIHLDIHEMSSKAVALLHRMITERNPALQETCVVRSDQLMRRESTGPVPQKARRTPGG